MAGATDSFGRPYARLPRPGDPACAVTYTSLPFEDEQAPHRGFFFDVTVALGRKTVPQVLHATAPSRRAHERQRANFP